MGNTYYIGWDVGAWHCDKNSKSRDCLYVLNNQGERIATVRLCIRKQFASNDVINYLNCVLKEQNERDVLKEQNKQIEFKDDDVIIMAIDAVLCWPKHFVELINNSSVENVILSEIDKAINNPFLYRYTERIVAEKHKPLSVVQGQIGSQSTKAIFFLKKYAFQMDKLKPGVWKCGNVTAIETYPAILAILEGSDFLHNDENDAKLCARLAQKFAADADKDADKKELLYPKRKEIKSAKQEGWIWVPKSCLPDTTKDASCPTP